MRVNPIQMMLAEAAGENAQREQFEAIRVREKIVPLARRRMIQMLEAMRFL